MQPPARCPAQLPVPGSRVIVAVYRQKSSGGRRSLQHRIVPQLQVLTEPHDRHRRGSGRLQSWRGHHPFSPEYRREVPTMVPTQLPGQPLSPLVSGLVKRRFGGPQAGAKGMSASHGITARNSVNALPSAKMVGKGGMPPHIRATRYSVSRMSSRTFPNYRRAPAMTAGFRALVDVTRRRRDVACLLR